MGGDEGAYYRNKVAIEKASDLDRLEQANPGGRAGAFDLTTSVIWDLIEGGKLASPSRQRMTRRRMK